MIKIELNLEEVKLVLTGLGELPAKQSMSVITNIQQQAAPQVAVSEENEGAE